ncbi:MAG: VOC family protein [Aquiluna sp.]|nr:VOC family protein [Aquiluna sp.]MCF8545351.1 VOC family protein [Aquiluna sp.]
MSHELFAITLYCKDLGASIEFYRELMELEIVYQDAGSCVFGLGGTVLNLIPTKSAPELVSPMLIADTSAASSSLFTIQVPEVDLLAEKLTSKGVTILNGPMDRSWGIRTLTIADPSGYTWEFSAPLNSSN